MSKETTAERVFRDVYEYFETGKEAKWFGTTLTPNEKKHGKVVEFRQEAFHDVTVYEDGYEERYYIGD